MTFTAPTTYDAAKALMSTDVETPIGIMNCSGAGLTGVAGTATERFSLNFHGLRPGNKQRMDVLISWDSIDGWVTFEERKSAAWTAGWDKLPKSARTLIELVITDLDDFPLHGRKDAARLVGIAKNRLIRAGKMVAKTCGRCGGSGRYSWNAMTGDRCFGCHGRGKVLPSTQAALKAAKN